MNSAKVDYDYAKLCSTLSEQIGYSFNNEGVLQKIKNNQSSYPNEIEDYVTFYIYEKLVTEYKMEEIKIPKGEEEGKQISIFISKHLNFENLLIIIPDLKENIRYGLSKRHLYYKDLEFGR